MAVTETAPGQDTAAEAATGDAVAAAPEDAAGGVAAAGDMGGGRQGAGEPWRGAVRLRRGGAGARVDEAGALEDAVGGVEAFAGGTGEPGEAGALGIAVGGTRDVVGASDDVITAGVGAGTDALGVGGVERADVGAREPAGARARAVYEGIVRRQSAREPAARTYARALPIVPVRARGLTIEGADGRRYLDCLSGAGTLVLGHNHPVVLEAIRKVLDSGAPLHSTDLATPVKDTFTTELFRTLPPELADRARIQFSGPAQTDAVAAAVALVRSATGRTDLLSFTGANQATTVETFEATTNASDAAVKVTHLRYPQDYRCPFGVDGARGAELTTYGTASVLDDLRSGARLPAAVIIEPVQGGDGVLPVPDAWMRRLRTITTARSVPLIADEAETGVGRTGAFWAVEHSGVTPDVMILSNAIGGSLPLSVVVYRDDLDTGKPGTHADAFRGNQLAIAAGTATLVYVRENRLAERAAELGLRMLYQLRDCTREFPAVGEVRGRGLMIGLEMVDGEGTFRGGGGLGGGRIGAGPGAGGHVGSGAGMGGEGQGRVGGAGTEAADADGAGKERMPGFVHASGPAAPELAAAVQQECLRRGLIVGVGGRCANVVRLLPPLTISDEQADAVMDRLTDAIETVSRRQAHGNHLSPP